MPVVENLDAGDGNQQVALVELGARLVEDLAAEQKPFRRRVARAEGQNPLITQELSALRVALPRGPITAATACGRSLP